MDFAKPTFEQMTRHWFEGDSVIREWQHEEGQATHRWRPACHRYARWR
jgi:carotenoid cleavage dioxygenase-like enzyme